MNAFVKEIYDWAVDSEDPHVFQIGDLWIDAKYFPQLEWEPQEFEQIEYTETKQACTIVNGIRDRWHRFGIKFTDQQVIAIVQYIADHYWYTIGQWRDTRLAMVALTKYFNKFYPEHKCYFARIQIDNPMFAYARSRWHSIGFTYQGNSAWNDDRRDGMLEWKKYIPSTYWHRSCLIYKNGMPTVDDSYKIKQYGIRYFKNLIMWQTVDGEQWTNIYWRFYVWISDEKQAIGNIKKYYKRKVWLEENINNNKLMAKDTVDKEYKKECLLENVRLQKKLDWIVRELQIIDK